MIMKHNGFEYIDLGLPSGTKWARCNVGANSETDNGLYFPCGGTVAFSYLYYENEFDFNKIKFLIDYQHNFNTSPHILTSNREK